MNKECLGDGKTGLAVLPKEGSSPEVVVTGLEDDGESPVVVLLNTDIDLGRYTNACNWLKSGQSLPEAIQTTPEKQK